LKEHGDWVVLPRTLEDLAKGRFAEDPSGTLHHDEIPIPKGKRLT
jgi:hypothetical protein